VDFEKTFFRILKKILWLPLQPEFFMELNYFNNFDRALCKEHPCKVSTNMAWTMYNGQWTITKDDLEDIVLR